VLTATMPAVADYRAAFEAERVREYPVIAAFESRCGVALDRARLEAAAKVLACPVKKSPPNWQHGRVLYAAARKYLKPYRGEDGINVLDIGTAKGFSALCLRWAMDDSNCVHDDVTSVDIIDPGSRVRRNTIAEVDGFLTLAETLTPWPEALGIQFAQSTGIDWLTAHRERIHVAFVDGSHNGGSVLAEGRLIARRQERGDLVIFDDVDRPELLVAVALLHTVYDLEYIEVLPNRHYAIGVRR
jgi:hypothetical protein